ncbi:hypothetical protein [Rhizobium sp. BK251]|uniref:hypothetical protein n=1 Tax=Rhizobium sp. BK251 TaxID=2512125 RepID=UPI0010E5019D|nr:hypothetical protein [Rhizobium sp. BK251]TCL70521.1 hypothetical protein EV286_107396 [Rhizobium sp. BK251]
MSSSQSVISLTSADLKMLQSVLSDAGYTGDICANPPREFNIAAKLLIRLFQEGITERVQLTAALERYFGSSVKETRLTRSPLRRYAIQGLHGPRIQ